MSITNPVDASDLAVELFQAGLVVFVDHLSQTLCSHFPWSSSAAVPYWSAPRSPRSLMVSLAARMTVQVAALGLDSASARDAIEWISIYQVRWSELVH